MAATVVIVETNGPQANLVNHTNPANINMGSSDSSEIVPEDHPITAQADGHSFEKWLRLYVSDLGGSTVVDNLKLWVSNLGGGFKMGEGISTNLRTVGYQPASYPINGPVDTDSEVAVYAIPESEPAGPNIGIANSLSGEITSDSQYSDWVVLQLDLNENTPSGSLNQKTFTFQFDEQ